MLHVECSATHGGQETPRLLVIGERKVFVEEVLDSWVGSDHLYFKLKGDDGGVYIIRQDSTSRQWELTMFRQGESS